MRKTSVSLALGIRTHMRLPRASLACGCEQNLLVYRMRAANDSTWWICSVNPELYLRTGNALQMRTIPCVDGTLLN
jgi:hypothetical protein